MSFMSLKGIRGWVNNFYAAALVMQDVTTPTNNVNCPVTSVY